MEGLAALNLAWAYLLAGEKHLCGAQAEHAAARLRLNGVAEADSAAALAAACTEEDGPPAAFHLQEAVTKSLGNPDIYQPDEEVLHRLLR